MDEISLRYAHCEGITTVCYDESGKYLITCGGDGDIRVWDGFEDDDPKTHHMGDTVSTVACKDGCLYLSTDANAVVVYSFPNVECEGVILQFALSVYSIACSPSGKHIAAGGSEFILKVYSKDTKQFSTYRGHDAPILDIALDPMDTYMASSSCDGSVKIWNIEDQRCVETFRLFKKSNDLCNSETLCHLDWYPGTGKYLAVPTKEEVKLYERDLWTASVILKEESVKEIFSIAKFSSCGSYLAASAKNGMVVVWDVKKRACVFKKDHVKNLDICSLVWNPSGKKELAFCDIEGQLGVYSVVISAESHNKPKPKTETGRANFDDNDLSSLLENDAFSNFSANENDLADINADSMDGSENAFDIGAIKAKLEPKIFGTDEDNAEVASVISAPVDSRPNAPEIPVTPLQISFQPSSTPLHLEQRFMVWNTVGIVRCYNTEEENSVDVEFHDASIYHPLHVNNIHGCTMAALSVEALLLACPNVDDASSKLQCVHIGTWDSNKEWIIDMRDEEEIEAVTLGSGWAAAATDRRFIRLFTVSGVQCETFCIPGPVVCLAGQESQLAIAYHRGAGIPGEQNLGIMLVKVNLQARSMCKDYILPLSSKAYLAWLGFTDEGHLCSVDTNGIVRILDVLCNMKWIPVADMKTHAKGKSDNYFVVGLSEIQQEIRCIPCKGARYPAMLPRPAVTVLPFGLPFCEAATDKGRLEEEQSRCALLHNRVKSLLGSGYDLGAELAVLEKKWTDTLLKMFSLAVRTDREYRALDIAQLMPDSNVVQGAIKYATQRHHIALAERLSEIVYKKVSEEMSGCKINGVADDSDDDDYMVESVPSSMALRLASRNDDDGEERIKPKPLSRRRSSQPAVSELGSCGTQEVDGPEEPETKEADLPPLFRNVNQTVNPFKIQSKTKGEDSSKANNSDIDDVLYQTAKRLSSRSVTSASSETKKKGPRQTMLVLSRSKKAAQSSTSQPSGDECTSENSSTTKRKKFGFALFLEEQKEELKKQHPDCEEQEIVKMATKLFKELPPDEKEKYKSKPKIPKEISMEENLNKRKTMSEQDETDSQKEFKKAKQTSSSNEKSIKSRFSGFAFSKA